MKLFCIFCIATVITLAKGDIQPIPSDILTLLENALSNFGGVVGGLVGQTLANIEVANCEITKSCSLMNLKVGSDTLTCYLYQEDDTTLAQYNTHVFGFHASFCVNNEVPTTCSNQACSNAETYFSTATDIKLSVGTSASNQAYVDDTDYVVAVCSISEYCFRFQGNALIDFSGLST